MIFVPVPVVDQFQEENKAMEMYSSRQQFKAFILIISLASSLCLAQSTANKTGSERDDLASEKALLVTELQALEQESLKLNDPLAESIVKAEIADAVWPLDRNWSKKLLRRAYVLALPEEAQKGGRENEAGRIPSPLTSTERSRRKVRHRILEIARRDKRFADELIQLEAEKLGVYEKQFTLAVLADQALEEGDVKASADYIFRGIETDPSQGTTTGLINAIALRDRALADRLVLRYIGELQKFSISSGNQSDIRIFVALSSLIRPYLPAPSSSPEPLKIQPPGPEVMRAYLNYMLETFRLLEEKEPGYLRLRRGILLSLWLPLQQYAPDLTGAFLNLEGRDRRPGEKTVLPATASLEEENRAKYESRINDGLQSDEPSEAVIYMAISRKDFDKARKMIDKLPDNARKKQLSNIVDAEEVISLIAKGKVYEAATLAEKLNRAASILKVALEKQST